LPKRQILTREEFKAHPMPRDQLERCRSSATQRIGNGEIGQEN
jgi:hypothetical protein